MSTTTTPHRRGRALATALLSVPLSVTLIGSSIVVAHASVAPAPDLPAVAVESAAGSAQGVGRTGSSSAAKDEGPATPSAAGSSSSEGAKTPSTSSGPLSGPQPLSNADRNGTGANPGDSCDHAYCSTRDGSASQNGNGDGAAHGKPCAGCVGKADNKDPKGQAPDGTDRNNGYECDGNQGIGRTNPAHTGCSGIGGDGGTQPTTPPTPEPTTPTTPPTTGPTPTPTASAAPGTATVVVVVDCFSVTVTSSKDISNVVVVFADGTSTKFDGLRGTTWTRTFSTEVSSATAKSATTRVTGTATGCGTPTTEPTPVPTTGPTTEPTPVPTAGPTTEPTPVPTTGPTAEPTPVPTTEPTTEPTPPTGTSPEQPGTVECPSGSTMQPGTGPGTGVDPVCTVPPVGPTPEQPGPVAPTCPAGSMPVSDTDPLVCVVPPTGTSPQLPGTAPTAGAPVANPLTPAAPVFPPARTPAGAGVLAAGAAAPTALPFTGGETTLLVGLGMVLLGLGTLLLVGTRRRELVTA